MTVADKDARDRQFGRDLPRAAACRLLDDTARPWRVTLRILTSTKDGAVGDAAKQCPPARAEACPDPEEEAGDHCFAGRPYENSAYKNSTYENGPYQILLEQAG